MWSQRTFRVARQGDVYAGTLQKLGLYLCRPQRKPFCEEGHKDPLHSLSAQLIMNLPSRTEERQKKLFFQGWKYWCKLGSICNVKSWALIIQKKKKRERKPQNTEKCLPRGSVFQDDRSGFLNWLYAIGNDICLKMSQGAPFLWDAAVPCQRSQAHRWGTPLVSNSLC